MGRLVNRSFCPTLTNIAVTSSYTGLKCLNVNSFDNLDKLDLYDDFTLLNLK